jgi:hypothetical protein
MGHDILVANRSFVCEIDGVEQQIHAGKTRVHRDHAVYRTNPDAFSPLTVHFGVEDASATPGEGRDASTSTTPAGSRRTRGGKVSDEA